MAPNTVFLATKCVFQGINASQTSYISLIMSEMMFFQVATYLRCPKNVPEEQNITLWFIKIEEFSLESSSISIFIHLF